MFAIQLEILCYHASYRFLHQFCILSFCILYSYLKAFLKHAIASYVESVSVNLLKADKLLLREDGGIRG